MIEALTLVFGGIVRLAPDLMKLFERKDERKHELMMFDKQLEADKLHAESAQKLAEIEANKSIDLADISALIEGAKAQSVMSGIKWIDGFSQAMRPMLTFYWCIVLYTVALAAQYIALIGQGQGGIAAILSLWGTQEKAIVASMIGFWFMDRALRKNV